MAMAPAPPAELAPFAGESAPLTAERFFALDQAGAFGKARVELIKGSVVHKMAQGDVHITGLQLFIDYVMTLPREFSKIFQTTLWLSDGSVVEPEAYVYRRPQGARPVRIRPEDLVLVVEIANTSLREDRYVKAPLYAEARIPEYWIVNPAARQIEVYRDPADGVYTTVLVANEGDTLAPLVAPERTVVAGELFPGAELSDAPEASEGA